MFLPFKQLPEHSRIWIYQAGRVLTSDEVNEIKSKGKDFVEEWTAHKQTLHASFEILHNIFLVIAVDEKQNDASGCSIDKSVNFIKQMETEFRVSLLDRFNIAFRDGGEVEVKTLKDFIEFFKKNNSPSGIHIFNNLVFEKGDLDTKWEIPLSESWAAARVN